MTQAVRVRCLEFTQALDKLNATMGITIRFSRISLTTDL